MTGLQDCITVQEARKTERYRYWFGHGLQLCAHSSSMPQDYTTHFKLLRIQGHVFSQGNTAPPIHVRQAEKLFVLPLNNSK
jgi:hypothetical protein